MPLGVRVVQRVPLGALGAVPVPFVVAVDQVQVVQQVHRLLLLAFAPGVREKVQVVQVALVVVLGQVEVARLVQVEVVEVEFRVVQVVRRAVLGQVVEVTSRFGCWRCVCRPL